MPISKIEKNYLIALIQWLNLEWLDIKKKKISRQFKITWTKLELSNKNLYTNKAIDSCKYLFSTSFTSCKQKFYQLLSYWFGIVLIYYGYMLASLMNISIALFDDEEIVF